MTLRPLLAALFMALADDAAAEAVPCLSPYGPDACYAGTVQVPYRGPSTFIGYSIGDLSLMPFTRSDLVASFDVSALSITSVTLNRLDLRQPALVDNDLSDGISFDAVAGGEYRIFFAGEALARVGEFHYGTYNGFFTIIPAIPEPRTSALMGLGLLMLGVLARRRAVHLGARL
jgi:hypothetical protein